MASPFINDGSVPYGSRIITINSVAYVADAIEVSRASAIIERTNQIGEPSGQVGVAKFDHGTATLQLAVTNTAIPALGMVFVAAFDGPGAANENFFISEVGQPEGKDTDKKLQVTFRKKYN